MLTKCEKRWLGILGSVMAILIVLGLIQSNVNMPKAAGLIGIGLFFYYVARWRDARALRKGEAPMK